MTTKSIKKIGAIVSIMRKVVSQKGNFPKPVNLTVFWLLKSIKCPTQIDHSLI
jgi:hypothetical protein